MSRNLKSKTVNALVWNSIDKVYAQVCYLVTGIILANLLLPDDFGLIGVVTVFIYFVNIFVDSGFSAALIQKQNVTDKDYSTIFYFNILVASCLYLVLYFAAPLIAWFFEDDRLILLSRVMFANVIFLSFGLVQSSMLMKRMDMKRLTIVNIISITLSSGSALWMALTGFGVWSLVTQVVGFSFIRTTILWITGRWRPLPVFSKESFLSIFSVGSHILMTSFISTFFQNIYSLIIGGKYSIHALGYYTQADKWSRTGTMALSQIVGNAFFPALSSIQDDDERMKRVFGRMNRMTAYVSFPAFIWLTIMAEPVFHCFFGTKWDASIFMFQLLIIRGLFFIFTSLLNNYIMATGKTRVLFRLEVVKDIAVLLAIVITIQISIPALVIGQLVVGALHHAVTAYVTGRITGYTIGRQIGDMVPYLLITAGISAVLILISWYISNSYVLVAVQFIAGAGIYLLVNKLLNSKIQKDIFDLIRKRKRSYNVSRR